MRLIHSAVAINNSIRLRSALVFTLFSFSLSVFSQDLNQNFGADTVALSKAIAKAAEIYTSTVGGNSRLLNGVQFKEIVLHNYDTGYPYFFSDDWIDGSVEYDGQLFKNVALMYDGLHDKIVVDHPYSHFSIQLISEKVKGFTLSSHRFVRLEPDSSHGKEIQAGFYEVLYDGMVKVYAKRRKEPVTAVEAQMVKTEYVDKTQFFIYKKGSYFPVKSKSSVLKVFDDRKSAVRKYINKAKLSFRHDREIALAESARFYDESEK